MELARELAQEKKRSDASNVTAALEVKVLEEQGLRLKGETDDLRQRLLEAHRASSAFRQGVPSPERTKLNEVISELLPPLFPPPVVSLQSNLADWRRTSSIDAILKERRLSSTGAALLEEGMRSNIQGMIRFIREKSVEKAEAHGAAPLQTGAFADENLSKEGSICTEIATAHSGPSKVEALSSGRGGAAYSQRSCTHDGAVHHSFPPASPDELVSDKTSDLVAEIITVPPIGHSSGSHVEKPVDKALDFSCDTLGDPRPALTVALTEASKSFPEDSLCDSAKPNAIGASRVSQDGTSDKLRGQHDSDSRCEGGSMGSPRGDVGHCESCNLLTAPGTMATGTTSSSFGRAADDLDGDDAMSSGSCVDGAMSCAIRPRSSGWSGSKSHRRGDHPGRVSFALEACRLISDAASATMAELEDADTVDNLAIHLNGYKHVTQLLEDEVRRLRAEIEAAAEVEQEKRRRADAELGPTQRMKRKGTSQQAPLARVQVDPSFMTDFVVGLDNLYHDLRAVIQIMLIHAHQEQLPSSVPFITANSEQSKAPDPVLGSHDRGRQCAERLRSLLRADLRHMAGLQWPKREEPITMVATPEISPSKRHSLNAWANVHARITKSTSSGGQQTKPNAVDMDASSLIPESAAHMPTKLKRALLASRRTSMSLIPPSRASDIGSKSTTTLPVLSQARATGRASLTNLSSATVSESLDKISFSEKDAARAAAAIFAMQKASEMSKSQSSTKLRLHVPHLVSRGDESDACDEQEETASPGRDEVVMNKSLSGKFRGPPAVRVSAEPLW